MADQPDNRIMVELEELLSEDVQQPRRTFRRWRTPQHKRLINRSKAFTAGPRMAVAYLGVIGFLAYTIHSHITWGYQSHTIFLAVFFSLIGVLITYFLLSAIHWRTFAHLPAAHGRVLCIVPVYNEATELVHETVRALLRQTILPDKIHVVDDGSMIPLEPFDDPLVEWHRVPNAGKREAQALALKMHSPRDFDYILTVDSDSVCDDDALEQMLRAMSDDRIQACTGMIFVRNWSTNLLTRLTDINVVTSCLLFRMARSILGIVSPTSGALALYRAEVVYDNLDDYLTSGTAGDDRRLSFYALLRGQVVGVTEAVVSTQLPDRWGDCFRQRMRWSKSAWLGTPFVLTNMRWLMVLFYVFPLVFALLWPLIVATLVTIWITTGNGTGLWRGVLFWEICAITQTWIYATYRPGFTLRQRLHMWLLSPIYPILGLVILRPAAYWALTKLKDTSWHTREVATPNEAVQAGM
ncbi:MAG TPA: glycosyltransferase family 2 protein [Actinomycetes bacterium]|nr:glycosyltransferase family 2 protein [Actinomycetes bacterium]